MNLDRIISGCRSGDKLCQRDLVKAYAPVLMSICRRYTREEETARDALQETFINIFRYIESYSGTGSFEGWMKRIAANCSITYQKKHLKHFTEVDNLGDHVSHSQVPAVYSSLGKEDILKLLDKLPDSLYLVFNMHVVEGYSHSEISEQLNISEGTSRACLSRARARLIEIMQEEQEIEKKKYNQVIKLTAKDDQNSKTDFGFLRASLF